MTPRLAVSDLEVATSRGVPLVRGVSVDVAPAEIVGIVGESGCGKSMTLLATLGLLPADVRIRAGSVRLDGRELTSAAPAVMRAIRGRAVGMIFQDPQNSLNPARKVGDQIGEPLKVHQVGSRNERRQMVLGLMREVGIPDPARRFDQFPHEFSGGMQQRVLIAAAIACSPDLLLADEPTTALDVTVQAQVLDVLRELNRSRGLAIAIVTHDLALAAGFCDRIVVMYAGMVVESGPAATVMAEPAHPYTRGLLACLPHLGRGRRRLNPIPGEVPQASGLPERGCAFAPRCSLALPECRSGPIDLRSVGAARLARCIRAGEVVAG